MATTTTKTKSAKPANTATATEHVLKAGFVKGSGKWEGSCSCKHWDVTGGHVEADVVDNFEIHAKARGVSTRA